MATKKAKAADAGATESPHAAVKIEMLRLSDLFPSPTNPRKTFPETELRELAESIKANGLINPITVRAVPAVPGQYEVISGGRRYRASIMAGLLEIPCIIRELSDAQVIDMQIEENLHRQDVPALEEAEAFESLITAGKLTVTELAGRLNKSAAYVYRRLKLNNLDEKYRPFLSSGELAPATAEVIASYPQQVQVSMFKKVTYTDGAKTTFVETRSMRDKFKWEACTDLNKAIWPLWRNDIQPGLPACNACEKNTAVATLLFPDGEAEPKCTDKACWKVKESVWKALALKEWQADCDKRGVQPMFADLRYYEMNDKKAAVQILEYEPEVISRYDYEVVEEGVPGAIEVMFMGGEQWDAEERARNFKRGWIVIKEKRGSVGNGNRDWEMERIDAMEITEEEKQVMREALIEKRRKLKEDAAKFTQQKKWKRAILEAVNTKTSGAGAGHEVLIQVMRLFVRNKLTGYGMRSSWLDVFPDEAKAWKSISFAIRVNGQGEGQEPNPKWTKGCEDAWSKVMAKHKQKGDYMAMHEMAWSEWIHGEEIAAWLDGILIGADSERIIRLFIYMVLEGAAEAAERTYHNKDAIALEFFTGLASAAGINFEALKPELNLDDEENDEYEDDEYEDDEEEYEEDDTVLEDEESES